MRKHFATLKMKALASSQVTGQATSTYGFASGATVVNDIGTNSARLDHFAG